MIMVYDDSMSIESIVDEAADRVVNEALADGADTGAVPILDEDDSSSELDWLDGVVNESVVRVIDDW